MIPELSIIIPTTNRLTLLTECVNSIENGTITSHEIIIVANSDDGNFHIQVDKLKSNKTKVIHIQNKCGFIKACNKGVECASGRYICILNDDTVVSVKWARIMLRSLKNDVKQVGTSLKFLDKNFNSVEYCTDRPYLEGWCFIIDRQIYEIRGELFDSNLNWAYTEDADLSTYIMSIGYKIQQVDAPIRHVGSATLKSDKKIFDECMRYECDNKKYLIKKWRKR